MVQSDIVVEKTTNKPVLIDIVMPADRNIKITRREVRRTLP